MSALRVPRHLRKRIKHFSQEFVSAASCKVLPTGMNGRDAASTSFLLLLTTRMMRVAWIS